MKLLTIALALIFTAMAHGQEAAKYAGSESCGTCHEDLANAFAKTPHHAVDLKENSEWKGKACESCHGPGAKHGDSALPTDIANPAKMAASEANRRCGTCHRDQLRSGTGFGGHAGKDVACTNCHKIHAGPNTLTVRAPASVNALCTGCHATAAAQFQKPFHHRVPENAMSCVDCHNPHGAARVATQRTALGQQRGCLNCHADKRGPFPFEHAPMRYEGCGACHEAHGSANPRLLTRQEVRVTCLECHANLPTAINVSSRAGSVPPAFHDLRLPRYQNCTICHQKIHGSYVDRNLLR